MITAISLYGENIDECLTRVRIQDEESADNRALAIATTLVKWSKTCPLTGVTLVKRIHGSMELKVTYRSSNS
jgi:hypothetical protein